MVSTSDIRERFLRYFADKGHEIVPSSSLVPGNDKTLLFTNAGMVQFKELFTGDEKRAYQRATTSQRCVRAGGKHNDLDNVGYTARHHTFFEMLGNFSFGDYFKEDAIKFAWEFLTEHLSLPAEKLWVTVFEEDDEAEAIWINQIGVPADRVLRIGAKDNFWSMGDTGPCGPCSEIFYDHGAEVWGGPPGSAEEDGDRFIEIWNLVFMQFDRAADGTMTPLPKPCVDTGMGLERTAAILQHVHSNYEIDLFKNLIAAAAKVTGSTELNNPSLNVIADHIRTCAFLITDDVLPSNEGRGYVLRRIIRRAVRHGHKLGATGTFFNELTDTLVKEMGAAYPELVKAQAHVKAQLLKEEQRFATTLTSGMKILDDEVSKLQSDTIPGDVVFKLYDTYGFPVDLTADIARERNLTVDEAGFEMRMEAQRERARAASNFAAVGSDMPASDTTTLFLGYEQNSADATVLEIHVDGVAVQSLESGQDAWIVLDQTPFYGESGGQVGDTGTLQTDIAEFAVVDTQKAKAAFMHAGALLKGTLKVGDTVQATIDEQRRNDIRCHHSATHLLHGGLRDVLGVHVQQKGSLVNEHHLRFDFSHEGPIEPEQLLQVEQWVAQEIRRNSVCETKEMSMDEAINAGAIALFGEKYGERVRVVTLGDQSVELCGGTHVNATGDLGAVKITSESGTAAGIRRIEALSGSAALAHTQAIEAEHRAVSQALKASSGEVMSKLASLQEKNRELAKQVEKLQAKLSSHAGAQMLSDIETIGNAKALLKVVDAADAKALRLLVDQTRAKMPSGVLVFASINQGKVALVSSVSKDIPELSAGDVIKTVATAMGGRGGGKKDLAQGGADSLDNVDAAFEQARQLIAEKTNTA